MTEIEDALNDALLHHAAEMVLLGLEPFSLDMEAVFAVGFMQGARWAQTGDWRIKDDQ